MGLGKVLLRLAEPCKVVLGGPGRRAEFAGGRAPEEGTRWRRLLWRAMWMLVFASPVTLLLLRYVANQYGNIRAWFAAEMAVHGAFYLYGTVMAAGGMGLVALCAAKWAGAEKGRADRLAADSRRLKGLAVTDSLTGAYARGYLMDQIQDELKRADRYDYPVAGLFVDVDDFKSFNETHGHVFGDKVLRRVSEVIRATVRGTDTLGRYGGDEFLLLMPHTKDTDAFATAERLRRNVNALTLRTDRGEMVNLTVSVGVVGRIPRGVEPEQFLTTADSALRLSKTQGKNRTTVWDPARPAA